MLYSALQHAIWGTVRYSMQCGAQCITACSEWHSALQHTMWGTMRYIMQCGAQCITSSSEGHSSLQHPVWGTVHCNIQWGDSALQHAMRGTVHWNIQWWGQCITICRAQNIAACTVEHRTLQRAVWCTGLGISRFNSRGFQFLNLRSVMIMCFKTDMSIRYCTPSCLVVKAQCSGHWYCLCDCRKVELNRWDLRFP
jgi:hypothetical protein